jgi:chloramphenicol 3-O-phosphotransferase
MPRVVLVTGLQAAGKSTVGPLLAARLGPPAVSFDGDVLFTGVVSGRAEMTAEPSVGALRQLQLRYDGSVLLAQQYADAGFDFVCHDIILGSYVEDWMSRLERVDRHLVVLNPSYDVLAERELGRGGQNS